MFHTRTTIEYRAGTADESSERGDRLAAEEALDSIALLNPVVNS
jgi:hypothetical protein